MIHISELSDHRVNLIEDEVKVGDEVTAKVIRNEDGKIALSRKAVFETAPRPTEERRDGPRRFDRPPRRDFPPRPPAPRNPNQ
jgi:predicted RNA-binding protein with RPS1 domain